MKIYTKLVIVILVFVITLCMTNTYANAQKCSAASDTTNNTINDNTSVHTNQIIDVVNPIITITTIKQEIYSKNTEKDYSYYSYQVKRNLQDKYDKIDKISPKRAVIIVACILVGLLITNIVVLVVFYRRNDIRPEDKCFVITIYICIPLLAFIVLWFYIECKYRKRGTKAVNSNAHSNNQHNSSNVNNMNKNNNNAVNLNTNIDSQVQNSEDNKVNQETPNEPGTKAVIR